MLLVLDEIDADEDPFQPREVTDVLPQRIRQAANQGRDRQDLIVLGQLGLLQQVNHGDAIAALEMGFAELFQVRHGPH